jgi:outer membrane immunogenic protein
MKAILIGGTALSLLTASAFGADLGVPAMPPPPQPFTWTSCYGGLHGGGGVGRDSLTDTAGLLSQNFTELTSATVSASGYMLGGQIGCDYQFTSNFLLGIEGSASGGNISGKTTVALPNVITPAGDTATFKTSTDFLMSATARVGYTWDRWLLYAKGGVAGAGNKYSVFDAAPSYDFEGLENRIGWTAGAGIEWALWEDWSVRLEYDYYSFGQRNVTFIDSTFNGGALGPENIKQTIQVIKLGVNFHVFAGP